MNSAYIASAPYLTDRSLSQGVVTRLHVILHNHSEIMFNLESERVSAVARFVYSMFDTSRYREVEEKVHNVAWIFLSALR